MSLKTLAIVTTYLNLKFCEPELPRHNAIKIKYRNKVDVEADIK